ncbi:hypothetical protein [Companilactobacillus furfuricola]|uniref:hypothetical protein n=1 Tax=Companilactobacillus furfuricola TaxID=1462575 RepID=UPI000F79A60D|nr:hypothetical protein [Companilactobacillus furfuricola]
MAIKKTQFGNQNTKIWRQNNRNLVTNPNQQKYTTTKITTQSPKGCYFFTPNHQKQEQKKTAPAVSKKNTTDVK